MAKSKKKTASSSSDKSEILTEHLLDVAASFFLEKGFAGSSVSDMARHARASKESFYSRYPTKEELFRAVIRRQTDRMSERMKALFLSEAPTEVTLMSFGEGLLEQLMADEMSHHDRYAERSCPFMAIHGQIRKVVSSLQQQSSRPQLRLGELRASSELLPRTE